ncbi:putative importin-9 [Monocercomonoides exilis]|uniref:putative importin-9 n=1 Tax=Monocercomonoides exilis TaxID=2049356 RepID=UPI003559DDFB|nr:putative importin-9 [Monocercomonoides exilis]|eukprot:MONOS_1935.1-p1 / transcript=MONOS_1935.1 / gene=MONOS_1935 / organism=Monocercomonoides_exilis_PA203 / gene_product=unspecified product / transcript_product=unspecified product / location=Mono_scaffold00037:62524-65995(-) / protein_length=1032 / sequence_SO=supercontig / SO=protein_coding / is_pseudo=false
MPDKKVLSSVCHVIGVIAEKDYPDKWPELIQTLLGFAQTLQKKDLCEGAWRCLDLLADALSVNEFLVPLVGIVHQVLGAYNQGPTQEMLSSAISICRSIIKGCSTVKDKKQKDTKEFKDFLNFVISVSFTFISSSSPTDENYLLRVEVVRLCNTIAIFKPKFASQNMDFLKIIGLLSHALTEQLSKYKQLYIFSETAVEPTGLESLYSYIQSILDFFASLMDKDAMHSLMVKCYTMFPVLIEYAQMTNFSMKRWLANADNYFDDEEMIISSARSSVIELVDKMMESIGDEEVDMGASSSSSPSNAISAASTQESTSMTVSDLLLLACEAKVTESKQLRTATPAHPLWWTLHEAALRVSEIVVMHKMGESSDAFGGEFNMSDPEDIAAAQMLYGMGAIVQMPEAGKQSSSSFNPIRYLQVFIDFSPDIIHPVNGVPFLCAQMIKCMSKISSLIDDANNESLITLCLNFLKNNTTHSSQSISTPQSSIAPPSSSSSSPEIPPLVRITAAKSLTVLCRNVKKELISRRVMEILGVLTAMDADMFSNEEVSGVIDAFYMLMNMGKEQIGPAVPHLIAYLLKMLDDFPECIDVTDEVPQCLHILVSVPIEGGPMTVQQHLWPLLLTRLRTAIAELSAPDAASKPQSTVETLFNCFSNTLCTDSQAGTLAPGTFSPEQFQLLFNELMNVPTTLRMNGSAILAASETLSRMLRLVPQILVGDSLNKALAFFTFLLNGSPSPEAAINLGLIARSLVEFAGQELIKQGLMGNLVFSLITRFMNDQIPPSTSENLLLFFCFFIRKCPGQLEALLTTFTETPGEAIDAKLRFNGFLSRMCEVEETVRGDYNIKVTIEAMMCLVRGGNPFVIAAVVKGDPIDDGRIMTRSRSAHAQIQYSQIPFLSKLTKIVVKLWNEEKESLESNITAKKGDRTGEVMIGEEGIDDEDEEFYDEMDDDEQDIEEMMAALRGKADLMMSTGRSQGEINAELQNDPINQANTMQLMCSYLKELEAKLAQFQQTLSSILLPGEVKIATEMKKATA